MTLNKEGIISGAKFWKLGCNWGSNEPSFYSALSNNKIVIGHADRGFYEVNDFVLVAEGHSVLAIAQVKSKPIPIETNLSLVKELKSFNVSDFVNISYYEVEFFELPQEQIFRYQLQQGIVRVRSNPILEKASKVWLSRNTPTAAIGKRIMRLSWNSNNWEIPSGHTWQVKNQGNSNIAFENQYGFGYEEWLFNERFRINGYQYGYIRGVNNLSESIGVIEQITLYTIREDKQRCLVGNVYNVEIIEGNKEEKRKIGELISTYLQSVLDELRDVNADDNQFKNEHLSPNVKFKWDDVMLFNEPLSVGFLDGGGFNRYQPYRIKDELDLAIERVIDQKVEFNFQAGIASNTEEHIRSTAKKRTKVKRRHGEITDDLYEYLVSQGFEHENISVEKTRVGGAIVDVVLRHREGFDLFEVKTSSTALKNIRQALGQIFEYALMDSKITCKRLVIIGPAELTDLEHGYFSRLKDLVKIKLEYWGYRPQEELIENKFATQ